MVADCWREMLPVCDRNQTLTFDLVVAWGLPAPPRPCEMLRLMAVRSARGKQRRDCASAEALVERSEWGEAAADFDPPVMACCALCFVVLREIFPSLQSLTVDDLQGMNLPKSHTLTDPDCRGGPL